MIVVDTSVCIDFFRQSNNTTNHLISAYLEDGEVVALSAIFGELLQGAKNEAEAKVILEFWRDLPKVDETELLLEGGRISYRRKLYNKGLSLIDCYILAAAKANRFSLWTLDKKLLAEYQYF